MSFLGRTGVPVSTMYMAKAGGGERACISCTACETEGFPQMVSWLKATYGGETADMAGLGGAAAGKSWRQRVAGTAEGTLQREQGDRSEQFAGPPTARTGGRAGGCVVSWAGKVWRAAISSGQRGAMAGLEGWRAFGAAGGRAGWLEGWTLEETQDGGPGRSRQSEVGWTVDRQEWMDKRAWPVIGVDRCFSGLPPLSRGSVARARWRPRWLVPSHVS